MISFDMFITISTIILYLRKLIWSQAIPLPSLLIQAFSRSDISEQKIPTI